MESTIVKHSFNGFVFWIDSEPSSEGNLVKYWVNLKTKRGTWQSHIEVSNELHKDSSINIYDFVCNNNLKEYERINKEKPEQSCDECGGTGIINGAFNFIYEPCPKCKFSMRL